MNVSFLLLLFLTTLFVTCYCEDLVLFNPPPVGCKANSRMGRAECLQMISSIPGCDNYLEWQAPGCKKARQPATGGGCIFRSRCNFPCASLCSQHPECFWLGSKKKGKCNKRFMISKEFLQPNQVTIEVINAIDSALNRWRQILIGQPGWGVSTHQNICDGTYKLNAGIRIEDLHIIFDFYNMDGTDGQIAASAPCVNWNDGTTAVAVIRIDPDDLDQLKSNPKFFSDAVTHELGHVFGIGTKWEPRNLIDRDKFVYAGENGVKGYISIGGKKEILPKIERLFDNPGYHWDENEFKTEIMSPILSKSGNQLSSFSGRSLLDLSYRLKENPKFEKFRLTSATDNIRGRLLRMQTKVTKASESFHDANWESIFISTKNIPTTPRPDFAEYETEEEDEPTSSIVNNSV